MLRALGFAVSEERFGYSEFPGRYATPIAGAVLGGAVVVSSALVLGGTIVAAVGVLLTGVVATAVFARWMMREGVLSTPWLRAESFNLVATRGTGLPSVWLVAHLDSKSQPVPSVVRVAGVTLLAVALVLAVGGLLVPLTGRHARTMEWVAVATGVVGALPVIASVVGRQSDGAVDNASGVAAVLLAAALIPPGVSVGVLMPSAEELGLAGARAWVRRRAGGIALNCDGVDDGGTLVIMYNRPAPRRLLAVVQDAARSARVASVRGRRMPVGLLTDSTAFSAAGWDSVTVSHGSLATLRRVHTPADSLDNLRGASIGVVADVLARAVEALAP
ncbi:hypothetical protein BH11GEM1_BH11GEM1_32290 [soil metagenome]